VLEFGIRNDLPRGLGMGKSQRRFRAIIIDDMEFCRELLTDFLETRGYEVLSFPDVTSCPLFSAQQLSCPKHSPCADFLLLDNLMPHMTGLDYLELQQQGCCLLNIDRKVIFSANWTADAQARAKELDCQFFHKPYDFDKLEAWLDEQEKLISPDRSLVELSEVMGGRSR